MKWLDKLPFGMLLIVALTLGLAPFSPEPHIWEKIKLLVDNNLVKPLDMFDFVLHGTPWVLLGLKSTLQLNAIGNTQKNE